MLWDSPLLSSNLSFVASNFQDWLSFLSTNPLKLQLQKQNKHFCFWSALNK
jgi:hypothetical protein